MRESRRRSPESSRRRRRERERDRDRRDSREQLAAAADTTTTTRTAEADAITMTNDGLRSVPPEPIPIGSSADYYNPQSYFATHTEPSQPHQRPHQQSHQPQHYSQPYSQQQSFYNPYTGSPQVHQHQQQQQQQHDPMMHQSRALSSSPSSSSGSSLLDISRRYPEKSHLGGVLSTFFRTPSEHRRRRRRSATKKRRVLYFGNSSSSSVNSDLAYGNGYIRKPSSRNYSPHATGHNGAPGYPHQGAPPGAAPFKPPSPKRSKTDEEILALGRQLSDLARQQNEEDLRRAGRSKPTQLAAAAASLREFNRLKKRDSGNRGIGSSKPHGDSSDESDWEDASDDDSDSSDGKNSELAYGTVVSQAIRPSGAAAAAGAVAGAAAAASVAQWSSNGKSSRADANSIVDPRLFGPVNSLRGMINTPCGFQDDERTASVYKRETGAYKTDAADTPTPQRPPPSESADKLPMRHVYPVPTSDPDRFDVDRSSTTSFRRDLPDHSRPAPVPLQQPIPKVPVSSKVYDADKFDDHSRRESKPDREALESKGWVETALVGAAAAAAGAAGAAIVSGRDDKRGKDSERDRRRDDRHEEERLRDGRREAERHYERTDDGASGHRRHQHEEDDREKDRRRSKRESDSHKHSDANDHKRTSRNDGYEDGSRKRREVGTDRHPEEVSYRRHGEDISVEYQQDKPTEPSRSSRRESRRSEPLIEHRDVNVPDKADYHMIPAAESSKKPVIDPFQFQVDNFQTPTERPFTPQVVTVAREPTFDSPPRSANSVARLSRKDSHEIEQREADYRSGRTDRRPEDFRRSHEYEEEEHAARTIYEEARQATVPLSAAAVASAIAIERERSEERRREQYSDDGSRDRSRPPRDPVQEEADRHYRESVIARKLARDEVQSRDQKRHSSVVDRWEEDDTPEVITIVTPPDMEERRHEKGPYDEPNADVRIDNKIFPHEIHNFLVKSRGGDMPVFVSRDPSCERERPLLNLVLPTPMASRATTPAPEPQQRKEKSQPASDVAKNVIIGPRGDIIHVPAAPKSVTWGENETKSYEADSSDARSEPGVGEPAEKPRAKLNKSSRWGILAAAIAGSSTEPANEPDIVLADKPKGSKQDETATRDLARAFDDDASTQPPVPGPKPDKMPGGFADDIEFAATLAAGLQDTGFNPDIVIDDPTYRRRDSPPGSNELNGHGLYQSPYVHTVSDLGLSEATAQRDKPDTGLILSEIETPTERTVVPEEESTEPTAKLSKKEKRRLKEKEKEKEKVAKELAEAAASVVAKRSIDSPRDNAAMDDDRELGKKDRKDRKDRKRDEVVVVHGDDSPRDTEPESSQGREIGEEVWEESSRSRSKKGKKSRDSPEVDSPLFSLPSEKRDDPASPREKGDDWGTPKKSKKKSRHDGIDSPARSEVSVDSSGKRSSKSKRRSGTGDDFYRSGTSTPERSRDPFEDREVSSVVSEPRYERRRDSTKSKRSSGYYDDDTASVASAPGSSRKSKEVEKRSSGLFSSIFKSNGHKEDGKRESFLDNAGTLGAGAGIAGAAVAVAAGRSRYNAAEPSSEMESVRSEDTKGKPRELESFDPEIVPRAIKPAIDPQYGDLLPLPPSEPGTPTQVPEEMPNLPESRPDTPPEERGLLRRERGAGHVRRRSTHDTPIKSPSVTAIPISLRLGNRQSPSSPGLFKPSPVASPVAPSHDSASRRTGRPTSWDNSREFKPLYLLEHSRHGPNEPAPSELDLPALPPSEPSSSRESPAPEHQLAGLDQEDAQRDTNALDLSSTGLRIDTALASASHEADVTGSQETTPKAGVRPELPQWPVLSTPENEKGPDVTDVFQSPDPVDPVSKNRSSYLLNSGPSSLRSNRSVDVGSERSSAPDSTPTKTRSGDPVLSDIAEDLTSADEHFSDALEGQSGDDFHDFDDASVDQFPIGPILAPPTLPVEEVPAVPDTPIDEDSPEWASLSAKERKKLKKARKKALEAAAVGAVGATLLGTSASKDAPEEAARSLAPTDLSAPVLEEATPFATPLDTPTALSPEYAAVHAASDAAMATDAGAGAQADDAQKTEPDASADLISAISQENRSLATDDMDKAAESEPQTETTTEVEEAPTSSKKSKKKKKKGKASAAAEEVAAAAAAEIVPVEQPVLDEDKKLEEQSQSASEQTISVEDKKLEEQLEPALEQPISTEDKKLEIQPQPNSEQTILAEDKRLEDQPHPQAEPSSDQDLAAEIPIVVGTSDVTEPKPESVPEPAGDVTEEVSVAPVAPVEGGLEEAVLAPAPSKKDKKKKKKKGAQVEDSPVADDAKEASATEADVPTTAAEPASEPSAPQGDVTAITTDPVGEPSAPQEETATVVVEPVIDSTVLAEEVAAAISEPLVEAPVDQAEGEQKPEAKDLEAQDTLVSKDTTELAEPPTDAAPTAKSKKKKNKRKSLQVESESQSEPLTESEAAAPQAKEQALDVEPAAPEQQIEPESMQPDSRLDKDASLETAASPSTEPVVDPPAVESEPSRDLPKSNSEDSKRASGILPAASAFAAVGSAWNSLWGGKKPVTDKAVDKTPAEDDASKARVDNQENNAMAQSSNTLTTESIEAPAKPSESEPPIVNQEAVEKDVKSTEAEVEAPAPAPEVQPSESEPPIVDQGVTEKDVKTTEAEDPAAVPELQPSETKDALPATDNADNFWPTTGKKKKKKKGSKVLDQPFEESASPAEVSGTATPAEPSESGRPADIPALNSQTAEEPAAPAPQTPSAPASDDVKAEEAKAEEAKTEEAKTEEAKSEEAKSEETRTEDAKPEEVKADETKSEETKPEDAWGLPFSGKKSKKKKKRDSVAFEDPLAVAVAESVADDATAAPVDASELEKSIEPSDPEKPAQASEPDKSADPVAADSTLQGPMPEETPVPEAAPVQTEEELAAPVSGKKSKKKKKKGSVTVVDDTPPPEPAPEAEAVEATASSGLVETDKTEELSKLDAGAAEVSALSEAVEADKTEELPKSEAEAAEVPASSELVEADKTQEELLKPEDVAQQDVAAESPAPEPQAAQEAQAEDEWSMTTGGKKSKKKKKSKQDKSDSLPAPEVVDPFVEAEELVPASLTGEALTEEPTALEPEPQPELGAASGAVPAPAPEAAIETPLEKTEETLSAEPATPNEPVVEDEPAPTSSKKSKKKKKKTQSLIIDDQGDSAPATPAEEVPPASEEPFLGESTEALASVSDEARKEQPPAASVEQEQTAETLPDARQQDAPEPEAEPEVTKKGKKNKKKKKNTLSLDETPAEQPVAEQGEADATIKDVAETNLPPDTDKEASATSEEMSKDPAVASLEVQEPVTTAATTTEEQPSLLDKEQVVDEALVPAETEAKSSALAKATPEDGSNDKPEDPSPPVKLSKKEKKRRSKQAALQAAEQPTETNKSEETTAAPEAEPATEDSGNTKDPTEMEAVSSEGAAPAEQPQAEDPQANPEDDSV
jgi:hypothetical protein